MDDPWGSPWTLADQDHPPDSTPQPPFSFKVSTDPKPPQAAVLANNPHPILSFSSLPEDSPWAEDNVDNAFGDWATADPLGGSPTAAFAGAASPASWAGALSFEGHESTDRHRLSPRPKEKVVLSSYSTGQPSPIEWPASAALSPAASPGPSPILRLARTRSRTNSSLSRLSSDPWRTATLATDSETVGREVDASRSIERDIPVLRLDEIRDAYGDAQSAKGERAPEWKNSTRNACPGGGDEDTNVRHDGGGQSRKDEKDTRQDTLSAKGTSRPSSRGSDHSRYTGPLQDSPTTSIEDDSNTRPPLLQRTSSSKVQDLVEMFDGLSKSTSQSTLEAENPVDSGALGTGVSDGKESLGDDSAQSLVLAPDTLEPSSLSDSPASASPASDSTAVVIVQARTEQHTAHKESATGPKHDPPTTGQTATGDSAAAASQTLLTVARLLRAYGHQPYSYDQSRIHELFQEPDVPAEATKHETGDGHAEKDALRLDAFIPEYILEDSFTSISERKAWYRMSRQGSYRRHNAGDDENYRPVTWATSTARGETVKIVRRWMEDDSLTGKPNLGGGGGVRGNLFGWDSAAEPVALDQVFKKSSKGGSRHHHNNDDSISRTHKPTLSTVSSVWDHGGDEGVSASPVADQGAEAGCGTGFDGVNAEERRSGADTNSLRGESIQTAFERLGPQQPSEFAAPKMAINTSAAKAVVSDEGEDEWGEMVSSPTAGGVVSLTLEQTLLPTWSLPPAPLPTDARFEDELRVALIDSIIRGLPDLSYMAA